VQNAARKQNRIISKIPAAPDQVYMVGDVLGVSAAITTTVIRTWTLKQKICASTCGDSGGVVQH